MPEAQEQTRATHTPGPWAYRDAPEMEHRMVFTADGKSGIARLVTHIHEYGVQYVDEMRANAHLIAAAPDLLAACKRYMELDDLWRQGKGQGISPRDRADLDIAFRDAIAKAESR